MLQIVAALTFFLIAVGAVSLIAAMLSVESDAIFGALFAGKNADCLRLAWPARIRLVSMPVPAKAGFRQPQRARA